MATSLTFEFGFAAADPQEPGEEGQPMRILVLGDFSGRAAGLGAPRRIDIDNFEQVLAQLAPSVQVTLDGAAHTFRFSELDDFHPDQLYLKSDAFEALREQRQRLRNPATFAAAAASLQSGDGGTAAPAAGGATAPDDDFASLLGGQVRHAGTAASAPASLGGVPPIDQLIRQIVGAMPPGPDPRQSEYIAAVDGVIALRMRAVLHAPAFQALEAIWRGLRQLVTGLVLGQDLQLYMLDAGKAALQADIDATAGDLEATTLHKLLVEQPRRGADAAPWTVLCGAYSFGPGEADTGLLAALGALGARAHAPFIAGADYALAGAGSLAATPAAAPGASDWQALDDAAAARWRALRASPQARWLGLALPRVLLRLPYGKATDSIEQFDFEEADAGHAHEDYLWGHASLAVALLLGRAFEDSAWDMAPGDVLDLEDLPAHTVRRGGEVHMQACAEAFLSERAGTILLEHGLMPLLSFKNRNAARLLRSQSISHPAQALSGAWNS